MEHWTGSCVQNIDNYHLAKSRMRFTGVWVSGRILDVYGPISFPFFGSVQVRISIQIYCSNGL